LPEIEAILILLVAVAAPDRLVVGRTYRYVRNPMYVAILTSVTGQALLLTRPVLLAYAAVSGLWPRRSSDSTRSSLSPAGTARITKPIGARSRPSDLGCTLKPAGRDGPGSG